MKKDRTPPLPYSDRVRQAFLMARQEALRLGHEYVGTEHILLGLLREAGGVAAAVLRAMRVDREAVRRRVIEIVKQGAPIRSAGSLPYTSRAKKALDLMAGEARELGHSYVGTEHVLLGLLREGMGVAAQVLTDFGLTLGDARIAVLRELRTPAEAAAPTRAPSFTVRIDDASDRSIYEQIVERVQEAVATGALESGARLPAVRQLADELDIAPGTVARAYGELERRGVVVTEGARGTRVAQRPRPAVAPGERPDTLVGLLRPVAVAAFHLGASAGELRRALERAMVDIDLTSASSTLPKS